MNKISIGETILRGYGFTVRRILGNLGLTWLAAVFYGVAAAYWLHQFCTTILVSPHSGGELNDFALFDIFGFVVTTAFGSAVIARALTGTALEPGGETMTAYFAVAKREWFLFLSLLSLYALVIAAVFAVVLLGGLAINTALPMVGNVRWQGIDALSAMDAAVALVAFAVTATLAVRLGFFAAAIASTEGSMSIARAWSISRGNSWRVFVVAVALSVPAFLLWGVAQWAVIGNDLATVLSPSRDFTALYQSIDGNVSIIAGLWAALIVVLNMLFAGASAPAYLIVRDNVSARVQRSAPSAPVLEPAFAGSFAGFAPRHIEEPVMDETVAHVETAPETFVATPIAHNEMPVTTAEMPADAFVAESETVHAPIAEASTAEVAAEPEAGLTHAEEAEPLQVEQHQAADLAHHDDAHDPLVLADEVREEAHAAAPQEDVAQEAPAAAAEETATVMQFPLGTDGASDPAFAHLEAALAEPHVEAEEATPRPSHDGEMELSPQSAPSEAA